MNIAIPVSLIGEDEMGMLTFMLFVQVSNGYLSKEHLNLAIQASKDVYNYIVRKKILQKIHEITCHWRGVLIACMCIE